MVDRKNLSKEIFLQRNEIKSPSDSVYLHNVFLVKYDLIFEMIKFSDTFFNRLVRLSCSSVILRFFL